jgi:hypothetical protein
MQNAALGNKKYCIRGHKEMGLEEFYHEESNTLYDSEHQDQQEYKKVTNKGVPLCSKADSQIFLRLNPSCGLTPGIVICRSSCSCLYIKSDTKGPDIL